MVVNGVGDLRGGTRVGGKLIETAEGAKKKADLAEQNAIEWAKDFGLGSTAIEVPSGDANAINGSGFYKITSGYTNLPSSNAFFIVHIQHTNVGNYSMQVAFSFGSSVMYVRYNNNYSWNSWSRIETTTGSQDRANTAETNAKNASLPRSGGTLNGSLQVTSPSADPLTVSRTGGTNSSIRIQHDTGSKYLGIGSDFKLRIGNDANISLGQEIETSDGSQAKVNTHASSGTHPASNIVESSSKRFVSDTEKSTWNTAESNAKSYAENLNAIKTVDSRSVNSPPSYYYTSKYQMEFKQLSVIGLTDTPGTYCTVMTDGRWSGSSGGQVTQMAFTDNGSIWRRVSTSTTTWGEWDVLETDSTASSRMISHNVADRHRKITYGTAEPTGGSDGDIYFQIE